MNNTSINLKHSPQNFFRLALKAPVDFAAQNAANRLGGIFDIYIKPLNFQTTEAATGRLCLSYFH